MTEYASGSPGSWPGPPTPPASSDPPRTTSAEVEKSYDWSPDEHRDAIEYYESHLVQLDHEHSELMVDLGFEKNRKKMRQTAIQEKLSEERQRLEGESKAERDKVVGAAEVSCADEVALLRRQINELMKARDKIVEEADTNYAQRVGQFTQYETTEVQKCDSASDAAIETVNAKLAAKRAEIEHDATELRLVHESYELMRDLIPHGMRPSQVTDQTVLPSAQPQMQPMPPLVSQDMNGQTAATPRPAAEAPKNGSAKPQRPGSSDDPSQKTISLDKPPRPQSSTPDKTAELARVGKSDKAKPKSGKPTGPFWSKSGTRRWKKRYWAYLVGLIAIVAVIASQLPSGSKTPTTAGSTTSTQSATTAASNGHGSPAAWLPASVKIWQSEMDKVGSDPRIASNGVNIFTGDVNKNLAIPYLIMAATSQGNDQYNNGKSGVYQGLLPIDPVKGQQVAQDELHLGKFDPYGPNGAEESLLVGMRRLNDIAVAQLKKNQNTYDSERKKCSDAPGCFSPTFNADLLKTWLPSTTSPKNLAGLVTEFNYLMTDWSKGSSQYYSTSSFLPDITKACAQLNAEHKLSLAKCMPQ